MAGKGSMAQSHTDAFHSFDSGIARTVSHSLRSFNSMQPLRQPISNIADGDAAGGQIVNAEGNTNEGEEPNAHYRTIPLSLNEQLDLPAESADGAAEGNTNTVEEPYAQYRSKPLPLNEKLDLPAELAAEGNTNEGEEPNAQCGTIPLPLNEHLDLPAESAGQSSEAAILEQLPKPQTELRSNLSSSALPARLSPVPSPRRSPVVSANNSLVLSIDCGPRPSDNEEFRDFDIRLATLSEMGNRVTIPPDELAEAGFYYNAGIPALQCFLCRGVINLERNQDTFDCDPWTLHARHFPECSLLLTVKGKSFVRRVQNRLVGERDSKQEVIYNKLSGQFNDQLEKHYMEEKTISETRDLGNAPPVESSNPDTTKDEAYQEVNSSLDELSYKMITHGKAEHLSNNRADRFRQSDEVEQVSIGLRSYEPHTPPPSYSASYNDIDIPCKLDQGENWDIAEDLVDVEGVSEVANQSGAANRSANSSELQFSTGPASPLDLNIELPSNRTSDEDADENTLLKGKVSRLEQQLSRMAQLLTQLSDEARAKERKDEEFQEELHSLGSHLQSMDSHHQSYIEDIAARQLSVRSRVDFLERSQAVFRDHSERRGNELNRNVNAQGIQIADLANKRVLDNQATKELQEKQKKSASKHNWAAQIQKKTRDNHNDLRLDVNALERGQGALTSRVSRSADGMLTPNEELNRRTIGFERGISSVIALFEGQTTAITHVDGGLRTLRRDLRDADIPIPGVLETNPSDEAPDRPGHPANQNSDDEDVAPVPYDT